MYIGSLCVVSGRKSGRGQLKKCLVRRHIWNSLVQMPQMIMSGKTKPAYPPPLALNWENYHSNGTQNSTGTRSELKRKRED